MISPAARRTSTIRAAGALAVAATLAFGFLGAAVSAARAQMPTGNPAQEYEITIGRIKYAGGGDWYNDPSTLVNWLAAFQERTGIPTAKEDKVVSLTDENLRAFPFLFITGHGTIRLTPEEITALRRYLEAGGFLYADDDYGMDTSFRATVKELFPEEQMVELPNSHPIYHCFYDLPGLPKIHKHNGLPPQGLGITIDGRLVLYYTYETNIVDGLADPQVHNDPPAKREQAMKMAVNILIYALTQNALM